MRWWAMQRFDSGVRRAKTALPVGPFDKPKKGRIAVTVINHLGDEVMKGVSRMNGIPCLNFSAFS
jgi:hypothetical protein